MKAYRPPYDPTPEEIQRECERIRAERNIVRCTYDVANRDYEYAKPVYRNPARLWRHGLH